MKKNKPFLLIVIFFVLGSSIINAQEIEYAYDNAGNRVLRQIYVMRKKSDNEKSSLPEISAFEDTLGTYDFTLYPNPTRDVLHISAEEDFLAMKNKKVFVYDLTGKLLIEQEVNDRITKLDFSDFVTGQYIVKMIADKKQIKEWKVIRE